MRFVRIVIHFIFFLIGKTIIAQSGFTVTYNELYNIISFKKQRNVDDYNRRATLYFNGDSIAFYSFQGQKPDESKNTVGGKKDHHALFLFPKLERLVAENFWVKPYNLKEYPLAGCDWKFYTDTLMIAGYLCNVAVADGITAWFTRDISFPFGPVSYYGLPGLIMMIEDHRTKRLYKAVLVKAESPKIILPDAKLTACENCESRLDKIRKYFTD